MWCGYLPGLATLPEPGQGDQPGQVTWPKGYAQCNIWFKRGDKKPTAISTVGIQQIIR